tara:strand:- start:21732 stop:21953 length:222 start_codon:yes stop_codon:yes gene_type:complete
MNYQDKFDQMMGHPMQELDRILPKATTINRDAGWEDYEDMGENCPSCNRPPFRFLKVTGFITYQCKCGEEWER